jgi:hypothetical protein
MSITTQEYMPGTAVGTTTETEHECHFGLKELSKGLLGILMGYLLVIGVVAAAAAVLVFVIVNLKAGKLAKGDAMTIVLAGAGAIFLAFVFTGWTILRNKWRCLMNAPERGGAKWWMFASMVCVFATPALNTVCGFMGGYSTTSASRTQRLTALEQLTAEKYMDSLKTGDAESYMRLAGAIIGPLGGMFFILFVRAVAISIRSKIFARLAEVHLVLDILLLVGSLVALFDISRLRFLPHVWLLMGALALVSFVLWLVLILGTVVSINTFLSNQRSPLEDAPSPTGW